MDKPEALRLADGLESEWVAFYAFDSAAELRRLHQVNQELVVALEKLARLGNGDEYGSSEGNMIARAALTKHKGQA